jgi:hypothetical protein
MALRKIDKAQVPQHDIRRILESIDKSYIGGGWYNDGLADEDRRSVDYYNAMGFHYYGLLYSRLEKVDKELANLQKIFFIGLIKREEQSLLVAA